MTTTNLQIARDAIAARWTALTPPIEPAVSYTHFDVPAEARPDGGAAHRGFWFDVPTGGELREWSDHVSGWRFMFRAHVQLSATGNASSDDFNMVAEAVALMNAANLPDGWPAGVELVSADRFDLSTADHESWDLAIAFTVETQEIA